MKNFLKVLLGLIILFALVKACSGSDEKDNYEKGPVNSAENNVEATPESYIEIKKTNGEIDEYGFLKVYATITNNSNKLATYVQFDITVTDKKGNVIGTGIGNTTNLGSGKTRVVTGIVSNIHESNTGYSTEITTVHFK